MPRTGRPKVPVELTDEERDRLQRWARRRKSSQALALRSRIVLACAGGLDNKTVAAELGCASATVGKWRARFVEHRLDGLADEDRPGRPERITAEQVEDVVVATLEATPANPTHWSRPKMAERTGLSKVDDRADLDGIRAQAPSGRGVQAVQRPAVRGEGLRHRRSLREPSRRRGGAQRR